MEFHVFQREIRALTPFDTGVMMTQGWMFFDTPYRFMAITNDNEVPYIGYNEEGTIYTKKNKHFIRKKITGRINEIAWSESLGLPYSSTQTDETLSQRNSILMGMGVVEVQR